MICPIDSEYSELKKLAEHPTVITALGTRDPFEWLYLYHDACGNSIEHVRYIVSRIIAMSGRRGWLYLPPRLFVLHTQRNNELVDRLLFKLNSSSIFDGTF